MSPIAEHHLLGERDERSLHYSVSSGAPLSALTVVMGGTLSGYSLDASGMVQPRRPSTSVRQESTVY